MLGVHFWVFLAVTFSCFLLFVFLYESAFLGIQSYDPRIPNYRRRTVFILLVWILFTALITLCLTWLHSPLWWIWPLLGLTVAATCAWIRYQAVLYHQKVLDSGICFLHTLAGLVQTGMALPTALFKLTETIDSPFSIALMRHLRSYKQGAALETSLRRLRARTENPSLRNTLRGIELLYRSGLPLNEFLENRISQMEAETEEYKRILGMRANAWIQATLATLLPWSLLVFMSLMSSDLVAHSSSEPRHGLYGLVLSLQILGWFAVKRAAGFP